MGQWSTSADYRVYVFYYDMLFIEELSAFFLIGGHSDITMGTISKFADGLWSPAGQLNTARNVRLFALLSKYNRFQFQVTSRPMDHQCHDRCRWDGNTVDRKVRDEYK